MQEIKQTLNNLRRPHLAVRDRADLTALMHDRFQSPRSRKRASALLLLDEGFPPEVVYRRTHVGIQSQSDMLKRLSAHGVQAAVFGSPVPLKQRRYDVKAIAGVLRECLASRPPMGALSWNLEHLTAVVRGKIAGAELITKETVRFLLNKELGIKSIWKVDPYWLIQIRQKNAGTAVAP